MRSKKRVWFLLPFMMVWLTACSVFSPIQTASVDTYVLNSVPAVAPSAKKTHRGVLLVTYPQASPIYNTTQMAYSTQPYKMSYFAKNQWAATPAQMLQPLMVSTLQKTHYFRQVITPGTLGQYHYVLNTQLLQCQQVFSDHSSYMRIVLRAQLINAFNNNVIASKEFSVEEAAFPTPYGGVVAMNRGVAKLLEELAQFVVQVT